MIAGIEKGLGAIFIFFLIGILVAALMEAGTTLAIGDLREIRLVPPRTVAPPGPPPPRRSAPLTPIGKSRDVHTNLTNQRITQRGFSPGGGLSRKSQASRAAGIFRKARAVVREGDWPPEGGAPLE